MEQPTYQNFDLIVERTDSAGAIRVRTRVQDSPAGQSVWVELALPFTSEELAAASVAQWSDEASRAYATGDAPTSDLAPQQFGERLFAALMQPALRTCLDRSLAQVEQAGEGLRIRLRLNDAPALAALPWEYLYGPAPYGFFALSRQTPLVRYLRGATR